MVFARLRLALLLGLTAAASGMNANARTFTLPKAAFATEVTSASLVGSFNDWSVEQGRMKNGGKQFTIDEPLADGEYGYQFFLAFRDGKTTQTNDPGSAQYIDNGGGKTSSYLCLKNGKEVLPLDLEKFEWTDDAAKNVVLAGEFNAWQPEGLKLIKYQDGVWRCWLKVKRPVMYKFIVDNLWKVENTPGTTLAPDNFGEYNNLRAEPVAANPAADELLSASRTRAAFKIKPEHYEELREQAKQEALDGDYAGAIAVLKLIDNASSVSERVKTLYIEADTHRHFNKREQAAQCWRDIIASTDTLANRRHAYDELAKHELYTSQNPEKAIAIYQAVLALSKAGRDRAGILHDIGLARLREQSWPEAERVLAEALKIAPAADGKKNEYSFLMLQLIGDHAIALSYVNRNDEAIKELRRAIKFSPWPDGQEAQRYKVWIDFIQKKQ